MCHVLVIEDEWLIGEHLEEIARSSGASCVDRAETEQEAIDAALAHPPAVILSDVRLVEGTGARAAWTIRERLGHCPVIFITGTPEACEPCDYAHVLPDKPLQAFRISEASRAVAPESCDDRFSIRRECRSSRSCFDPGRVGSAVSIDLPFREIGGSLA